MDLKSKNKLPKILQMDNAGENKALETKCLKYGLGVSFEYTAPGTPQQISVVE